MKTIVVKTQAEFDALPETFAEYTEIEIRSEKHVEIVVRKTPAYDSATVTAYDGPWQWYAGDHASGVADTEYAAKAAALAWVRQ